MTEITVNGNEYNTAGRRVVGQQYKDPNACGLYEPHALHVKIHAFLQEMINTTDVKEVLASGDSCGSNPTHPYISYTNQRDQTKYQLLFTVHNTSNTKIKSDVEALADKLDLSVTIDDQNTGVTLFEIEA